MSNGVDLQKVLATLNEYSGALDSQNDIPSPAVTKGVGDGVSTLPPSTSKVLSMEDQFVLRRSLMGLDQSELAHLFTLQLQKDTTGIPLHSWMQAGNPYHNQMLSSQMAANPTISKAIDLAGTQALIRQDLEPILYSMFVKSFPAWDRFAKEPANGQVHSWNQITDYGDAEYMTELGTVTDDNATYQRQTTNIAVLATRRGASLKSQLSILAGGMNWDAERLEIQAGLTAMAHRTQKTIFQGNATNSGGTLSNELGAYDPNAFTGLRQILNTSSAVNFQPYLTSNPDGFVEALGAGVLPITNAGGVGPSAIYLRTNEAVQINNSLLALQRFVDRTEVTPGISVPTVAAGNYMLPLIGVPGDSIGSYTTLSTDGPFDGGETVADIYALNESSISLPYLGSPGPTVLDIPMGVSGQLVHLYIIWLMNGLAVKALVWNNKVRADLGTS